MRSRNAGFSFIELIVSLAIMVMLASVVTPVLLSSMDGARIDAAIQNLARIGEGIGAFANDVGDYPSQLTQLVEPLSFGSVDLCPLLYTSTQRSRWRGPYVARVIPATGLPVSIGRARNQLSRYPSSGRTISQLRLTVDSVVVEDAQAVNQRVDGDEDANSGAVLWTAPNADGLVSLTFAVPVNAQCW